ncbi:branched-chain alpha-keto acid dehydrogenase subunit E2 [Coxiella burnetii]|uniref:dihydrolipoamide acetyltransferase family protein n=1 Tax=Coxiella burnetii TaxID=777 RepID=UPI0003A17A45|nr:dihydrolipoamide acetyltransferase family protein [Coxiella burnetii]AML48966.1 branched-chain alpha-keto acid dehydrogenase subunit E2 [Coxiella burnetii]AML54915.1 branched-chain alpha-keto acid dehydrogenase subunit E2 [Coxiella burnetii]ATN68885.1 branched-chain alpha-keto acid dehydrogenase subunit E2 [Coxiella burnetii]ATN70806.1 branched-chain alpha-keto acid dehydrogenase subunit E2 [Coxiella burnetii]ATN72722.1 branched-chain alpha-keto acid dehydrogenase subunit E2 [Coxiella burne
MKVFKLPDLGEGLPDATIREWYIAVGDEVKIDQPLVAMETAKALVDVPSPLAGKIEKLFGEVGDVIETGSPLIGFEGEAETEEPKDTGTVVGAIETSDTVLEESGAGIPVKKAAEKKNFKATPAVRMLAKQLGVDLTKITPKSSLISAEEVKQAAQITKTGKTQKIEGELTPLSPVRRAMAQSMSQSHREVVPVSLMDDGDLSAWKGEQDITLRIIRAIEAACQAVPIMNAHFDGETLGYKLNETINIGIAVDTPQGLYVPVLKDVSHQDDTALRNQINRFKELAQSRSFPPEDLRDATIMLSNFGAFAGRYANPILLPPMVTIIGVGRTRDEIVPVDGKPAVHRILPLSVTSDHRVITGGEIAGFLKQLIDSLEKAS